MAALDDLKTYLTTTLASAYPDEVLEGVIATEAADQASRVKIKYRLTDPEISPDIEIIDAAWPGHPAPLREAVTRRCARNLALRKLPLGIAESDVAALRIAGREEIRRLEAPYARMTVG